VLLIVATFVGDVTHMMADPRSDVPSIGASGGISGVIVYYALQFPRARLGFLFRFYYRFSWIYFPAYVALIFWALLQLFQLFMQLAGASSISALAHLGGAAVGLGAWLLWRKSSKLE
jgi:membrane associated rhomboid family serine protease